MSQSQAPAAHAPRHRLALFSIISLVLLTALAVADLAWAERVTVALRDAVTGYFDWLLAGTVSLLLLLAVGLALHPQARRRLGHDDERPVFSRWSWFAMLFSAGLASGLVYWGAAEPISHFGGNPFVESSDPSERAVRALTVTVFHWGLHGWGLYVVAALAVGITAYRHDKPLAFSAALHPLLGDKHTNGWIGHGVDLLALYGTVFGVATSIGLAVAAMNATVTPLTGIPFTLGNQVGIVVAVCLLAVLSTLSGVARGIRRLSELNVWLSLALLLVILAVGPTVWLLKILAATLFDYSVNAIPMGWWLAESSSNHAWQTAWTTFYWGWWLAWTPFVAIFIARISRGRTIREFILGVLLVPALVVSVWMSILGGTALHQEMSTAGAVSAAVDVDYSHGLVATLKNLPVPGLHLALLTVVAFLLFTWLITSLDSATLVICHILRVDRLPGMKILWGFALGAVTCTLMLIGGVTALQAASIIVGLPLALLMLLIAVSAAKLVLSDGPAPSRHSSDRP